MKDEVEGKAVEATDSFLLQTSNRKWKDAKYGVYVSGRWGCLHPQTVESSLSESPNQDIFTSGSQRILHLLASRSQFSSCRSLASVSPFPSHPPRTSLPLVRPRLPGPCAPPPPLWTESCAPGPVSPRWRKGPGPRVSCTRWPAVRRRLRP